MFSFRPVKLSVAALVVPFICATSPSLGRSLASSFGITTASNQNRTIFIGDVHGCIDEMRELLKACNYNSKVDKLVFVGDLIGKGPASVQVVEEVMKLGAACVMGNHDHVIPRIIKKIKKGDEESMMHKEHYSIFKALNKDQINWMASLPKFLRIPEHNVIVVHGGILPGVPLEDQHIRVVSRIRNVVFDANGVAEDRESTKEGVPWVDTWEGAETVIFGHDAARGLQVSNHCIGLDSGACYGNYLTAYILPDQRWVSVKSRQVYCAPKEKRVDKTLHRLHEEGRLHIVEIK